jgi:hypothetical protein
VLFWDDHVFTGSIRVGDSPIHSENAICTTISRTGGWFTCDSSLVGKYFSVTSTDHRVEIGEIMAFTEHLVEASEVS